MYSPHPHQAKQSEPSSQTAKQRRVPKWKPFTWYIFLYIELVSVQTGCCVLSEKHGKHENDEIDPPKRPVLPSSYERLQEKL